MRGSGAGGEAAGCFPELNQLTEGLGGGAFGLKKSPGWDTHEVGLPSNEPATGPKVSATPSIRGRIGGAGETTCHACT